MSKTELMVATEEKLPDDDMRKKPREDPDSEENLNPHLGDAGQ